METKDPALSKTPIIKSDTGFTENQISEETTVNKGADSFKQGIVATEHVKAGDNAARQPDRRDQKGNPFDDNINEHNIVGDTQKSAGITNENRYATIDNAQTRVLNPDEKDVE